MMDQSELPLGLDEHFLAIDQSQIEFDAEGRMVIQDPEILEALKAELDEHGKVMIATTQSQKGNFICIGDINIGKKPPEA